MKPDRARADDGKLYILLGVYHTGKIENTFGRKLNIAKVSDQERIIFMLAIKLYLACLYNIFHGCSGVLHYLPFHIYAWFI